MPTYRSEFYNSPESVNNPYAVTPDNSMWVPNTEVPHMSIVEAVEFIKENWMGEGQFQSARVVELDDKGNPTSVVWMSQWEAPLNSILQAAKELGINLSGAGSGQDGHIVKLQVWMQRDFGPPDHWPLQDWFDTSFKKTKCLSDSNSWDLEYGRLVDTSGKMNLWSIKLNIWPVGSNKHPSAWRWARIFQKDEDHAHEVEVMRIHDIGPRTFPSGVETNECSNCGKIHLASTSWLSYNSDGETGPFCSCFCIDSLNGTDEWRATPDGMDVVTEPACEVERGRQRITAA